MNNQLFFFFISISQYLSLQCFNHHATDDTFQVFYLHFLIILSVLFRTAYILLRVFFCIPCYLAFILWFWMSFCSFYQTGQFICILAQRSNACCLLLCPIEGLLPHNKSKPSCKDIIPDLVQNNVPCQKTAKKYYVLSQ